MNDTKPEDKERRAKYEIYLEERKLLIQAEKEGSQQFDKAILTLAAGALAISITFINQIAPHPKPESEQDSQSPSGQPSSEPSQE